MIQYLQSIIQTLQYNTMITCNSNRSFSYIQPLLHHMMSKVWQVHLLISNNFEQIMYDMSAVNIAILSYITLQHLETKLQLIEKNIYKDYLPDILVFYISLKVTGD